MSAEHGVTVVCVEVQVGGRRGGGCGEVKEGGTHQSVPSTSNTIPLRAGASELPSPPSGANRLGPAADAMVSSVRRDIKRRVASVVSETLVRLSERRAGREDASIICWRGMMMGKGRRGKEVR